MKRWLHNRQDWFTRNKMKQKKTADKFTKIEYSWSVWINEKIFKKPEKKPSTKFLQFDLIFIFTFFCCCENHGIW